jgi:hypothetical protein
MKSLFRSISLTVVFTFLCEVRAQDHSHLNVGAVSQTQGSKLTFENGADFAAASLYVKTLTFTNAGKYANLYQGNISLTALHSVDPLGNPQPGGPAPGSFIVAEVVSVKGPAGGAFQFWDTNSTTQPSFSAPVGTENGSFRFDLTDPNIQGAGQPGGDPFGHIHGRRFTVTKPGLYTVGWRAVDTSANGAAGANIHSPSEILNVHFQGGSTLTSVETATNGVHLTFGATAGLTWQLEAKDDLAAGVWRSVGEPIIGQDKLVQLTDPEPVRARRYYRLSGSPTPL